MRCGYVMKTSQQPKEHRTWWSIDHEINSECAHCYFVIIIDQPKKLFLSIWVWTWTWKYSKFINYSFDSIKMIHKELTRFSIHWHVRNASIQRSYIPNWSNNYQSTLIALFWNGQEICNWKSTLCIFHIPIKNLSGNDSKVLSTKSTKWFDTSNEHLYSNTQRFIQSLGVKNIIALIRGFLQWKFGIFHLDFFFVSSYDFFTLFPTWHFSTIFIHIFDLFYRIFSNFYTFWFFFHQMFDFLIKMWNFFRINWKELQKSQ